MPIYGFDIDFDILLFEADLNDPAPSPILYISDDGGKIPLPFTTTDAGHDRTRAMSMIVAWLGPDYYTTFEPDALAMTAHELDSEKIAEVMATYAENAKDQ